MKLTRSKSAFILKVTGFTILVVIVVGYTLFRSIPYIQGPQIRITSPQDGSTIATSTIRITGQAARINSLFINGSPISIDKDGNFAETLIVFKGANIITVDAVDRFKRTSRITLHLLGSY